MPYCPNCGARFTEGASYCPACGAPLPKSSEESPENASPFDNDSNRSEQPPEEPISTDPVRGRRGDHFAEPAEPQYAPVPASQPQSDRSYEEENPPITRDGKPEGGPSKQSWHDFMSSPGKVGIVVRLSLVFLIPIVGPIMASGYMFTWAADRAYGNRVPLPNSVIHGPYLLNGWRVFVVSLVISLVYSAASGLIMMLPNWLGIPEIVADIVDLALSICYLLLQPLFIIMELSTIVWQGMGQGFNVSRAWQIYVKGGKTKKFLGAYLIPSLFTILAMVVDIIVFILLVLLSASIPVLSMLLIFAGVFVLLLNLPILVVCGLVSERATGAVMADVLAENHY